MPVPSTIADITVVATTNSPPGTETVTTSVGPDEYMRSLSAIIRREQAQGAALASAATVNIGATTDGNYVHITGTVAITGFGTIAAGISRTVVFTGILTLTHNATSLILKSGANRTTAVGDVAEFVSEGAGNWREVAYHAATTVSQPLDATLTALAGLATGADQLPYSTGADTFAQTAFTPFSRTVLDDVDAPAWRATLVVLPATDVLAGLIELATNAEATAGTDTVRAITPAGLRGGLNAAGTAPVYACRAWVNFNGATGAVIAGGNVASVTRNGVGDYTITFTTAMPDANYSGFATCGENNGIWGGGSNATTPATTTAWRINFRATDNSARDVALGFVGIFR